MDFFPISLDLNQRPCLVIGGGKVGTRKVFSLLDAGASITLVSPEATTELKVLADQGAIRWEIRPYRRGEVVGYWLVVCAVNSLEVQRSVYLDCERARVWINSVDQISHSSFIFPAIAKKGHITIAVNTAGNSPFFSSWLAKTLGSTITEEHLLVLDALSKLRSNLKEKGYSTQQINWESLFELDLIGAAKKGVHNLNSLIDLWISQSGFKL